MLRGYTEQIMTLPRDAIRRHIFAALAACLLEAASYAVMFISPKNGGTVVVGILLLPGTLLSFFVGGGMSMVDGVTPEWRTDAAFAFGLLLNTALMYAFCLRLAKIAKIVGEALQTTEAQ
jgi:hypothetical protein